MKRLHLIILLLASSWQLYSQPVVDSIRQVISSTKDPDQKANSLIALCEQFRVINPDSLLNTSKELYRVGEKNKNETWKSSAEFYTATAYNLKVRDYKEWIADFFTYRNRFFKTL